MKALSAPALIAALAALTACSQEPPPNAAPAAEAPAAAAPAAGEADSMPHPVPAEAGSEVDLPPEPLGGLDHLAVALHQEGVAPVGHGGAPREPRAGLGTAGEAAAWGEIFVTATGNLNVFREEHFRVMSDGALLSNSGHFDAELELSALERLAEGHVREVRDNVREYDLGEKKLYLLAEGRLVNLGAAEGHPAAVMDMSFAGQALAAEYVAANHGSLDNAVHVLPEELDSGATLADVASRIVGPWGAVVMALTAVFSIGGNLAGSVLGALPFAPDCRLRRDGRFGAPAELAVSLGVDQKPGIVDVLFRGASLPSVARRPRGVDLQRAAQAGQ